MVKPTRPDTELYDVIIPIADGLCVHACSDCHVRHCTVAWSYNNIIMYDKGNFPVGVVETRDNIMFAILNFITLETRLGENEEGGRDFTLL